VIEKPTKGRGLLIICIAGENRDQTGSGTRKVKETLQVAVVFVRHSSKERNENGSNEGNTKNLTNGIRERKNTKDEGVQIGKPRQKAGQHELRIEVKEDLRRIIGHLSSENKQSNAGKNKGEKEVDCR